MIYTNRELTEQAIEAGQERLERKREGERYRVRGEWETTEESKETNNKREEA